jgi:hypothetical protein
MDGPSYLQRGSPLEFPPPPIYPLSVLCVFKMKLLGFGGIVTQFLEREEKVEVKKLIFLLVKI